MDTTTASSSKPLEYLVLDAGALIRGHGIGLYQKAKKIVTVPDVLAEIRDSKSRELLNNLPFEIEERMPSQSSINAGS
jgi:rRNA maturation endonuclease Nob1